MEENKEVWYNFKNFLKNEYIEMLGNDNHLYTNVLVYPNYGNMGMLNTEVHSIKILDAKLSKLMIDNANMNKHIEETNKRINKMEEMITDIHNMIKYGPMSQVALDAKNDFQENAKKN